VIRASLPKRRLPWLEGCIVQISGVTEVSVVRIGEIVRNVMLGSSALNSRMCGRKHRHWGVDPFRSLAFARRGRALQFNIAVTIDPMPTLC
jgi:hypothetical protein